MRVNPLVTPLFVLDPALGRRRVDPLRVTPLAPPACYSMREPISYSSGHPLRVNPFVTPLFVLDPAVGRWRVDPLRVTPLALEAAVGRRGVDPLRITPLALLRVSP